MFPTRRITTSGGDVFRDEFSLAFDGTDDFIDCGNVLNQGSNDFSISVWFKAGTNIAQYEALCAKRDTNATGFVMDIRGTDPFVIGFAMTDDSISTKTILGSTSITLDTWNHYIVVVDRTGTNKIHGYLNGVLDNNPPSISTLGSISNTESFGIGGRIVSGSVSNKFVGNISEIAVYNKALSASEVKTLYNGREPYNHKEGVCSSNLQAWYRMGDGLLDGNRRSDHEQSNNDSVQDNIISDESNSGLGAELYTFANALSTSAHESTNITSDGGTNYTNGFHAFSGTTIELESSITNGSSHALKYTTDGSGEGFRIDLSNHVSDSGTGLDVGSVYQISVDARHIGTGEGNAVHSIRLSEAAGLSTTGETLVIENIDITQTDYINYKVYFIYNATTTRYFGAREANSNNDSGGLYIDNLSIKKVNGNAGIMNNFSFEAIEGDTP